MSLQEKISKQLLVDYIRVKIHIWVEDRSEIIFHSGMEIPEEELLRERFCDLVYQLDGKELVELAQQVTLLAPEFLKFLPTVKEQMDVLFLLLQGSVGLRDSIKYVKKYNLMERSDPKTLIEYFPQQENELKEILLKLKEQVSEGHRYKVNGLIEQITGHIDALYD